MTDRELLELAAKAAGVEGEFSNAFGEVGIWLRDSTWNPLTNDGDALRLAVKLLLHIEHDAEYQPYQRKNTKVRVRAEHQALIVGKFHNGEWQKEFHNSDPCAATRRAIVRAAAEIGGAMK